jgi:hypothetical protein
MGVSGREFIREGGILWEGSFPTDVRLLLDLVYSEDDSLGLKDRMEPVSLCV